MKNVPSFTFLAALSLSVSSAALAGDVVTLTYKKGASEADNARTATLTLAAGESAKAKWGGMGDGPDGIYPTVAAKVTITIGDTTKTGMLFSQAGDSFVPMEVAGPAKIVISSFGSQENLEFAIATFEVTRLAAPSVTPSNAAVIPEDANGTFTVILESSTDLITWTAANPGDYSGNTVKRFFRTRIVKK
jgi:hypothetical protein